MPNMLHVLAYEVPVGTDVSGIKAPDAALRVLTLHAYADQAGVDMTSARFRRNYMAQPRIEPQPEPETPVAPSA